MNFSFTAKRVFAPLGAMLGLFIGAGAQAGTITAGKWEIASPNGYEMAIDGTVSPNPVAHPTSARFGLFLELDVDWTTMDTIQYTFTDKTPEGETDAAEFLFVRFSVLNDTGVNWDAVRFKVIDNNGTPQALPGNIPVGDNLLHPLAAHLHTDHWDTINYTGVDIVSPDVNEGFDYDKGIYEILYSGGVPIADGQSFDAKYLNLHDKIKENEAGEHITSFTLEMTFIPEPDTALLVGLGLTALGVRRRVGIRQA
jgi:hypothetical protein